MVGVERLKPEWLTVVGGGMGDVLQCLPFMIANRDKPVRYVVSSHLESVADLFDAIDIKVEQIGFFKDPAEGNRRMVEFAEHGQLCHCPRTHYFAANPFPIPKRLFKRQGKTLGIHLGASKFSIDLHNYQGLPIRTLPSRLVQEFLNYDDLDILLFGSKDELSNLGISEEDNLKWVCCSNVAESLAYVCHCDAFLGSDSGLKTMSSMLRIPTIVWMGGHGDPPRDANFILPYMNAGFMAVYRYGRLDTAEYAKGLDFTKSAFKRVFND